MVKNPGAGAPQYDMALESADAVQPGDTLVDAGGLRVVVDAGVSAQARLTVPLNPFVAVTDTVDVPPCPADAMLTGVAPTEKSGVATKPGHEVTSV